MINVVSLHSKGKGTDALGAKALTYADDTGGLLVGTTHVSGATDKSIEVDEIGGKITVGIGMTDVKGKAGVTGGT